MNPLKTHRKQLLNKLISSFFSKKELKNFNNIVSTELSSFKSFGSQVSAKNKKQITLDVDNEAGLQSKIELLLTYARQMLNARKYTELLNKLGEFMKIVYTALISFYGKKQLVSGRETQPVFMHIGIGQTQTPSLFPCFQIYRCDSQLIIGRTNRTK